MAFSPQDLDGNVDAANAYVTVEFMRAFWLDRGVDLQATTDADLQVAIIKATDFLDARYAWVGWQLRRLQGTQWPRGGISLFLRGLPPALLSATCMLANRALSKPLMPDPAFDASGQTVQESTKKVGPIEVSTKFAESSSGNPAANVPQYPEVTLLLKGAGLTGNSHSGSLSRG